MPIVFSSEKPRKQLLEHGIVYTFRAKRRKRVGDNWAKSSRNGTKICDVYIEEIDLIGSLRLMPYVKLSGFDDLGEWVLEIIRLNEGKILARGWLYKVTKE